MSDTLTTPAAPGTAAAPATPVAPPSIAEAGAAFRAAESWADVGLQTMDVTDGGDDVPDDPPAKTPADSVPDVAEGPEFVQNAQGQWHRPDGTFANADEIAQINAQLASDAAPADAKPEDAPTATTVKLRTRDGSEREVQVDDPELAQLIQQNFNDGMRRKEYTERVAVVEAKLEQLNQIDALIDTNPEAFVAQSLNPEQKIRLASMLLAEHFEELVPIIQGFDTNPTERLKTTTEAQRRMREQEAAFTTRSEAQRQAVAVRSAVESLIPETVEQETAEAFWADASADLQRAIARGEKVDPSTVPQLLANRLKLYGITAGATTPASAPRITAKLTNGSPSSPTVAQPANDAAKALATAEATQRRIRLTQQSRRNAAAVPPVGAGAAPVRLPPVPKGASIEEAARAMKTQRSWTS